MRITENGLYRLTETRSFRGSISVETWNKGKMFAVTQISKINGNVIGPEVPDWQYPEIPCEQIGEGSLLWDAYHLANMPL